MLLTVPCRRRKNVRSCCVRPVLFGQQQQQQQQDECWSRVKRRQVGERERRLRRLLHCSRLPSAKARRRLTERERERDWLSWLRPTTTTTTTTAAATRAAAAAVAVAVATPHLPALNRYIKGKGSQREFQDACVGLDDDVHGGDDAELVRVHVLG